MNLRSLLLVASISAFAAFGCAVSSNGDEESSSGSEDALTNTPERTLQLDGLRARVVKDFPNLDASKTKLIFVVRRLHSNATTMGIQARIQKRDIASGKDSELSDADLRGSVYGELIQDGVFDGPELTAILEKKNGKWSVISKTFQVSEDTGPDAGLPPADVVREAYVVGPTDVAYTTWAEDYGIPASWLGL